MEDTTNGAIPREFDVQELIYETITAMIVAHAQGPVPLSSLAPLEAHVSHARFSEYFHAACTVTTFVNEECASQMLTYVRGKRDRDFVSIATSTKYLVSTRLSPFCLTPAPRTALPPPTVHTITSAPPPTASRPKAMARALQLIAHYDLWKFDAASSIRFLEWKFTVMDVCDIADDEPYVKLELLLNCLAPTLSADVRVHLNETFRQNANQPEALFNLVLAHLDAAYKNLRSTRHIESLYLTCKMGDTETLNCFLLRFQKAARLYERAKTTTLSDTDKIVSFGSAIHTRFKVVSTMIETTTNSTTFLDYAQRLLYLADSLPLAVQPASADLNAIDSRKRARPNEPFKGKPRGPVKGFGCFRCCQGNHTSLTCTNPVADYDKRCNTCGSRRHTTDTCTVSLTQPCRRCKGPHRESICPRDLPHRRTEEVPLKVAESAFDDFANLLSNAVASVSDCGSCAIVDPEPPMLTLTVGTSELTALFDTGAAANFIHPDSVIQLRKDRCIEVSQLARLDPPMKIRFGNSTEITTDMKLNLSVAVNGRMHETVFVVCPGLNPPVIAGRPLIKQLQLFPSLPSMCSTAEVCAAAWVEEVFDGSRKRLGIRFPIYENTPVEPIREPLRSFTPVTEQIIFARLEELERNGSVVRTTLENLAVVAPIVLVDKHPGQRKYPDPQLHSRYRITSDLRGYNRMVLSQAGENFCLTATFLRELKNSDEPTARRLQFQRSSFEIIRRIPSTHRFYSKIDLSAAYNSVWLPPSMRHVGAEAYDHRSGKFVYFAFSTLMQGWKYSPLFFRIVSNYLLERCREKITHEVYLAFYQDDILVCTSSESTIQSATQTVIDVVRSYSFTIQPEKLQLNVRELNFCGYNLADGKCQPCPTRKRFTEELALKMWNAFLSAYPHDVHGIISWLRSVTGMFQYYVGFLGPAELAALQRLYETISSANKTIIELEAVKDDFLTLFHYVSNGVPSLHMGAFPDEEVLASILITDANQGAWSGILIKLIRMPDQTDVSHPEVFHALLNSVRETLSLDDNAVAFLPVRLVGGKFSATTRKQSSTYKERVAQLDCLHECELLLQGPVILISDNRNCSHEWHDIEHLGGKYLLRWQRYCELVNATMWIPRESTPTLADVVARQFEPASSSIDLGTIETLAEDASNAVPRHITTLSAITQDIVNGYISDTTTSYFGIRLCDVYALKTGKVFRNSKIHKCSSFFEVDPQGLMWYLSGVRCRLYIPSVRIPTVQFGQIGLRDLMIRYAHCASNIHLGVIRTQSHLSAIWWPQQSHMVHDFVTNCYVCTQTKSRVMKTRDVLSSMAKTATRPFEAWHIDHAGPLEVAAGPRYFLSCVCAFSHYVYCVPVDNLEASTTAAALLTLFGLFGIPTQIHTDHGSSFTSELFRQVCMLLNIDHTLAPIAFPRSNGLAERSVGTIKTMLSTIPNLTLPMALPLVTLMHNATQHSRLRMAPIEGAFGFVPKTIQDLNHGHFPTEPFSHTIQYYTRQLYATRSQDTIAAHEHESYLASHVEVINPGDLVLRISKTPLQTQTTDGPYLVLSRCGSSIFRLLRLDAALAVDIREVPQQNLKRISNENPFLDLRPPVRDNKDYSALSHNDFFVARIEADVPTVCLYRTISNNAEAREVTAKLFKANRHQQFYATDTNHIIEYDRILLAKIKLAQRTLTQEVRDVVASFLVGVM